ncbi:MAG: acyl-CoA--6-aminopenicillanic acid acyltransferase [Cyclobacteriaceae bacterium]|nr:MAG: acyl-CoA--6-aminopenicillanic acid acyltransferase [Cyclobacteriaceae bacterium]
MCDILYIPPAFSQSGNLLFAKNSDREPDEAQAIELLPRNEAPPENVNCTYISIPRPHTTTYACIICRPLHMFGAEMGINEHGVAIGNEAVFTRIKLKRDNSGLTGMDLIRLALESSQNASQALNLIVQLLEKHGQDACGGYRNRRFFYHNSFLIADAQEAFVLETAGKHWAVEPVTAVRSLSNCLSIKQPLRHSAHARSFAESKGWQPKDQPFNFSKAYSDWLYTRLGRGVKRAANSCNIITSFGQPVTPAHCMQVLQSHHVPEKTFTPSRATTASICMHATGIFNPSETTGSMVAEVRVNKAHTVWLTGTPHPCLSVFIPFFLPGKPFNLTPGCKPDDGLWWTAQRAHRRIMQDYQKRKARIEPERQELQNKFLSEEKYLIEQNAPASQLQEFSKKCVEKTKATYRKWLEQF